MLNYPARLALAQLPTPIQPLDRFTEKLKINSRLWIKRDDLTGCAVSGNKVRKLEFTLADALKQDADVIITWGGVQSNHARTTAILGAQLGLKVHLLLRGEPDEHIYHGNFFLDALSGAKITTYPSSVYVPGFQSLVNDLCEYYRHQGLKPYFITTGASDGIGVWGYIKACEEISEQSKSLKTHFDQIICATGSGGTLAGLIAGEKLFRMGSRISGFNVCDTAAYFEKKVKEDLFEWKNKFNTSFDLENSSIEVIDGYVGRGYAKADPAIYRMITELARLEGIILDPVYTGKAFYGMINEIRNGNFNSAKNILYVHTGGLFGLMADKEINNYI